MSSTDANGLPARKHPAHQPVFEAGHRAAIVFLTLCTKNRRPLLARPEATALVLDAWHRATHWIVGRYVILPDHIHLFCAPGISPPHPLRAWISFWQNTITRAWPWPNEKPLWQKDCWDRQLRAGDSYAAKWDYVRNNPVRHGLVTRAEDWPHQGELHVLPWHDR